jgi:hypothetical protein
MFDFLFTVFTIDIFKMYTFLEELYKENCMYVGEIYLNGTSVNIG